MSMNITLQKLVSQIHENLDEDNQFFSNLKLVIYVAKTILLQ